VSAAVEMVALRLGHKRLVAMGGTAKTPVLTGLFSWEEKAEVGLHGLLMARAEQADPFGPKDKISISF
jgi:hypothetical protein